MTSLDNEATLDAVGLEDPTSPGDPPGSGAGAGSIEIPALWRRSWALFRAEPGAYVLGGLILLGVSLLTLGLLAGPMTVGFIRMTEAHRRGEAIEAGRVFDGMPVFGNALLAGVIIGLGVGLGTLLLIIPGVVLGVLWSFALHYVALRDSSAFAALGAAWRLARRQIGSVLLVLLAGLALTCIGSVVILGVVVTTPLALILLTLSFHELDDQRAGDQG